VTLHEVSPDDEPTPQVRDKAHRKHGDAQVSRWVEAGFYTARQLREMAEEVEQ
jgi:hypothetical protein